MLKLFASQTKFTFFFSVYKMRNRKNKVAFFLRFIYSLNIKSFDNQTIRMVLVNGIQF